MKKKKNENKSHFLEIEHRLNHPEICHTLNVILAKLHMIQTIY